MDNLGLKIKTCSTFIFIICSDFSNSIRNSLLYTIRSYFLTEEYPALHAKAHYITVSYVLLTLQEMFINRGLSDSLIMQNIRCFVLVNTLIVPPESFLFQYKRWGRDKWDRTLPIHSLEIQPQQVSIYIILLYWIEN